MTCLSNFFKDLTLISGTSVQSAKTCLVERAVNKDDLI